MDLPHSAEPICQEILVKHIYTFAIQPDPVSYTHLDVYKRQVEKYGVTPPELIEVKALMGDASDNIPGVPGIGEKTALSLIAQFHTIDSLYDALEKGEEAAASIKPGVRQKLLDGKDSAYNSRFLAQIVKDAPVDACLDRYGIDPVSYTHLDVYKRQWVLYAEHRQSG